MLVAGNTSENYQPASASRAPAKKPRRKKKQTKKCPSCQACFTPASGNQKFCSPACRKRYRAEQSKKMRETRTRRARKKAAVQVSKRRKKKMSCRNCRQRFTPTCPEQKYCNQRCRTQAKRCRTKTNREKILQDMYDCYRGRCYLCGMIIPLDAPPEHPLLLTRDHIIPKTVGGQSTTDNLAPAHKLCNNVKGDMTVQDFWESKRKTLKTTIAHLLLQLSLTPQT